MSCADDDLGRKEGGGNVIQMSKTFLPPLLLPRLSSVQLPTTTLRMFAPPVALDDLGRRLSVRMTRSVGAEADAFDLPLLLLLVGTARQTVCGSVE